MNEFLKYLLISLEDEKELVEELLRIDNQIQTTNFGVDDIVAFIRDNISKRTLLDIRYSNDFVILTEGNPLLTLKILNDFPANTNKIFISRSFVAINKWLVQKCINFWNETGILLDMELDLEDSYNHYLEFNGEIFVMGSEGFINGTQNDFPKELLIFEA